MEHKDNNRFNYTYTAPTEDERKEIENIRSGFTNRQSAESGIDRLRRLYRSVKQPPLILAIIFGTLGILVFGLGLTLILEWHRLTWGCSVGAGGTLLMIANIFFYRWFISFRKKKLGPEILELSQQLLGETK